MKDLDARMRKLEWFHSLFVPAGMWIVIRVDGRSFSKLTEANYKKPFDSIFRNQMVWTAQALLDEFDGVYCYTESDEISLLLPRDCNFFDREVEKLVSVSAAVASSEFTYVTKTPAQFDSRLWLGATTDQVLDYFSWRQADAARCCLNSWAYWTLREEGLSKRAATSELNGKNSAALHELLLKRNRNFNNLPAWQRRGTGVQWETYEKVGFNPITEEECVATRHRLEVLNDLPHGALYRKFIAEKLLEADSA